MKTKVLKFMFNIGERIQKNLNVCRFPLAVSKGSAVNAQSGNVLFLILIAVALFAALSYAVTSSSRSGAGDAGSETNLVNSALLTQYPSAIRTGIIRMIVSNGVDQVNLNFDRPVDFATVCNATPAPCVFHPSGGAATYIAGSAEVREAGSQADWIFTSDWLITDIGSTANDIIAFLPGIKPSVCKKINSELGITGGTDTDGDGVPAGPTAVPVLADAMDSGNLLIGPAADGAHTIGQTAFVGQAFGCYDSIDATVTANDLIYYHVLVER